MPGWIGQTFEYLVGMYMHPAVTLVVFIILLVSKVRFEGSHIQAAKDAVVNAAKAVGEEANKYLTAKKEEEQKADRISQFTLGFASLLSLAGQYAFYWPHSGQARALCFFFSFAQIGFAMLGLYFVDNFGLIDRLGKYFQKKVDEKTGA